MITDAKKMYYKSKFNANAGTGKGTWKLIKEITNGNLIIDDNKVADPVMISDYINGIHFQPLVEN